MTVRQPPTRARDSRAFPATRDELDNLATMASRPRARVYVDGFNLYMGALKGSAHKWLDLEAWADRLMPAYTVDRIVYCTARLQPSASDTTVHIRQDVYLRALGTLTRVVIREGHFKVNPTRMMRLPEPGCTCCDSSPPGCRCCRSSTIPVLKREEKGSDVRLALELLHDGFKDHYDAALVVSGDSDIQPAIDMVCQELGKQVIVADPRNRTHAPLKGDERRRIRPGVLAASQLPLTLVDSGGMTIAKPSTWP